MVLKAARSTHGEDYQHVNRPIAVLIDEYPTGFVDPPHAHERAQLLYATQGVMTVITDDVSFTIPPQRGVWMSAGVRHEAHCRDHVSLKTLYVATETDPRLVRICRAIMDDPARVDDLDHWAEVACMGRPSSIAAIRSPRSASILRHPR